MRSQTFVLDTVRATAKGPYSLIAPTRGATRGATTFIRLSGGGSLIVASPYHQRRGGDSNPRIGLTPSPL
jgi:hypothetical protein